MIMSEKIKKLIPYFAAGVVIFVVVIVLNRDQDYTLIHRLCDGFFVAGALLLGMGGLKFCRNQGAFDMISYGVVSTFHNHFPGAKMDSPLQEREDYVSYAERKRAERKSPKEFFVVGSAFMIPAVILLVVYMLLPA